VDRPKLVSSGGQFHGRQSGSRSHRSGIQRQAGMFGIFQHLTSLHLPGRDRPAGGIRAEL